MMVTFVSQCEKNALKKTRRVLDAFANRIGDNVWQSIITQDGLNAVKKLLRRTASKNTAVSCHWLRSRSRSELIWVVGRRDAFDHRGLVPVNITEKEVPMDITKNKPVKGILYANTKLQRLDEHLFAVGYVAKKLCSRFFPEDTGLLDAVYLAGVLHDIGKIDPCFQAWASKDKNRQYIAEDGEHIDEAKFSFEKHPRHNEISLLLYYLFDDTNLKFINRYKKQSVRHTIYWHHAQPFRKSDDFETCGGIYKKLNKNLGDTAWQQVVEKVPVVLKRVSQIDTQYTQESCLIERCILNEVDPDKLIDIADVKIPQYKAYDPSDTLEGYSGQVDNNAVNNIIRSCIITADRWISSLDVSELTGHINNKTFDTYIDEKLLPDSTLAMHVEACLQSFPDTERTRKQQQIAVELAKKDTIRVLSGPAGCGKTKIALEWANNKGAEKILWICPRVQICLGLFQDLVQAPYLPEASVEIYTGEYKYTGSFDSPTAEDEYFAGDVVITTIDQIFGSIVSHTRADMLIDFLNAHIVFDEFHEYITIPAYNLLFAELIACKKTQKACNTLLVSATPHYLYLKEALDISEKQVIAMPSFNQSRYQFNFAVYDETDESSANPLYQAQSKNTFVISNTATTAQKSFIINQHSENAVLLHSKYKKSDKKYLFEEVFDSFMRNGSGKYEVLRSGPIVQASLNITCDEMLSEVTTAENTLQRLGRLDRFGVSSHVNRYFMTVPESFDAGKGTGALARILAKNNSFLSAKSWYEFLQEHAEGESALLLQDIYKLYRLYYQSPAVRKMLKSDLLKAFAKSTQQISAKVSEPFTVPPRKKTKKGRVKISKQSLRGDSRFVQMAICDVTNLQEPEILNTYAYEINADEKVEIDNLTESVDRIENDGLLGYAAQKHGRVDEAHPVKKVPARGGMKTREKLLNSYARDPEYPIYLSYTPDDLELRLGGEAPYAQAVYYAVCDKQPIGTLSVNHCIKKED